MLFFRLALFVLLPFLMVMFVAPHGHAGSSKDTDYNRLLFTLFHKTAFYSEFGGSHRKGRIVKWTQPIKAQIFGPNAALYREEVAKHLKVLHHLSGVPIEILPDFAEGANLRIHLLSSQAISQIKPGADCYAELHDKNYQVVHADVYIVTNNNIMRRHCIAEELTQSMGLTNDSATFRSSIFNDRSLIGRLEPWDSLMLLTLYNPALKPGMKKEKVMPIAEAFLRRAARWDPVR